MVYTMEGMQELLTSTWRFWIRSAPAPAEVHLVYVTATAENLSQVVQVVRASVRSPIAVRVVRDVSALDRSPNWSGKAVTIYVASREEAVACAQALDSRLAELGLSGPPVLRARPVGGRSGMLFLRPLGRLTELLDG